MLFNSYEFLFLFLPFFGLFYFVLFRGNTARLLIITIFSYIFYGWWDYRFTLLMFASTLVDYVAGRGISSSTYKLVRRGWLGLSIICNLSLLGFFKYWDFIAQALNDMLSMLPVGHDVVAMPVLGILLPVGISFYTFQSMSYSIDIYRGQAKPAKSFIAFAGYVSMFPQLIAGPIVRYHDISEQLTHRTHNWSKTAFGLRFFVLGLAKKVIIADSVAPLVDLAFAGNHNGLLPTWIGVLAYTMQIYFDFSGYSDMAMGLGYMLGFKFPENFNSPYKAISITDFWHRWHMSLSSWLRDYLYIPLGGNRRGEGRMYVNLFLTMLLGGLWHGASWNFVLWGGYHGVLLALERRMGKRSLFCWAPQCVQKMGIFVLVLFGWILFRAENLAVVGHVFAGCVGLHGVGISFALFSQYALSLSGLLLALILVFAFKNTNEWNEQLHFGLLIGSVVLFVVCVGVILVNSSSPFLYFQF